MVHDKFVSLILSQKCFVSTYIKLIFALREAFGRELIISLVQNAMNNHNLHNTLYARCALTDSTR